ncbi:MAG: GlxA family transcriptional regulator [Pseudomonadota bacterium]
MSTNPAPTTSARSNESHDFAVLKSVGHSRLVAILTFPDVQILDVTGPLEVLCKANNAMAAAYRPLILAEQSGSLKTSGPLSLDIDRSLSQVTKEDIRALDTLIVPGGPGIIQAMKRPAMVAFVKEVAMTARRLVSVCSGTFLLAEAGLLAGRRATSHWGVLDDLQDSFPDVQVERNAIYVQDGNIWSSAGVTAGIDMTLALVEDDLGREVALAAARDLVVYMRRSGGQAQFAQHLPARRPHDPKLRALIDWIGENLTGDLSVQALAGRCAMSERNFSRRFLEQSGVSPARYVEQSRLAFCREQLEKGYLNMAQIAHDSGLKTPEILRRLFQRQLGISPTEYRDRFRSAVRR